MANRNQKITNFDPKHAARRGFTDEEKSMLFLALGQILINQDRLIRNANIDLEGNETFYDPTNSYLLDQCTGILEKLNPDLYEMEKDSAENNDDDEE